MAGYSPLELPKPTSLGAPGGLPIRQTNPTLPRPNDPVYLLEQMQKQPMQMPDVATVRFRLGDKNVVADLLRIANGEQPQSLTGIPSTYAARVLSDAGMPTTMDAWTGDQWKTALDAQAATINPMGSLLGGY